MMKILIISNAFPYPPDTGAKIRNFNLIKRLSQHNDISLISFVTSSWKKEFQFEMGKYCSAVETVISERRTKIEHLPGVIRCLLSGQPLDCKFVFIKEMAEKIKHMVLSENFDIIQIEHSIMAPYIKTIPLSSNTNKVLTFIDVGFVQFQRMFKIEKNIYRKARFFLNWVPMRKWEPEFAENFDLCITMSDIDKQVLKNLNTKLNISVVPNGVDTYDYSMLPTEPSNNNILFIGKMDYLPNIDAVLYFYKEILPIIKKQIPTSKFFIVGSNPPQKIKKLESDEHVIVTGYVDDVHPYYERCAIFVVPLKAGGGTRLKILESMASGRPVISTSLGCEGIDIKHNENILVADTPKEFAKCAIQLLSNIEMRQRISQNARKLVKTKYNWDHIADLLIREYEEVLRK